MHDHVREIIANHADALTLYARQFLDFHSAEEVVQDAIFRLVREAESKSVENPVAWLYKTVRNASLNRKTSDVRREKREKRRETQPWFESNPAQKIDAEFVTQKMQELPQEAREILTLHLWSELSFAAIGELLGISKATAFRRYEDALNSLRKIIGEDHE